MRHSLLSKFQGTLLGSALGDFIGDRYQSQLLGISPQTEDLRSILKLTKHQQLFSPGAMSGLNSANSKLQIGKNLSECGRLAVVCAQSLIRCNGLDVKDWHDTWEAFAKSEVYDRQNIEFQSILHPCEAAVAALPAAMFFHENTAKLREKLMLATEVWQNQNVPELQTGVLAVGYAIARSLKEKLDPTTAMTQTITYLEIDNALTELLLQVKILIEQGADLERAATHLCKTATALRKSRGEGEKNSQENSIVNPATFLPIAIAFYCFLSTPEDLRLSVVRAARCGIAGQLTCTLTGALSGAFNGAAAIPVEWRQALSTAGEVRSATQGPESSIGGTGSDAKIVELANHLFAVWAGVYSPNTGSESATRTPVVTAPYVIRPLDIPRSFIDKDS
jgi:ADP-ribosylglycohydrolase